MIRRRLRFFFFNDTPTTEIYTLSLHDALPILKTTPAATVAIAPKHRSFLRTQLPKLGSWRKSALLGDRKSTRLNSSHANISYAVFCLKKTNPALARLPVLPVALSALLHLASLP